MYLKISSYQDSYTIFFVKCYNKKPTYPNIFACNRSHIYIQWILFWPDWKLNMFNHCWSASHLLNLKFSGLTNWAPSSEFVSLSIPSWQILTAHAQPVRGARDLAFCLKVPLDSLLLWVSSGGSGETAWMRRLAWTFAARIGSKYQIRLTRSNLFFNLSLQSDIWDDNKSCSHKKMLCT